MMNCSSDDNNSGAILQLRQLFRRRRNLLVETCEKLSMRGERPQRRRR